MKILKSIFTFLAFIFFVLALSWWFMVAIILIELWYDKYVKWIDYNITQDFEWNDVTRDVMYERCEKVWWVRIKTKSNRIDCVKLDYTILDI